GKVASAADKTKKEKVYHPQSRKAGQLARKALRKGKMGSQASVRGKKHHHLADVYNFFYSCLPETGELCLDELHAIVRDIWLTRHDDELSEEQAARRKGRPKSVKEAKLEEVKLRESEEYRTGMEVIDLTHPPTVELFRRW
ncbi:translation machinery-associated protein 16, partial [Mucidula mucida]